MTDQQVALDELQWRAPEWIQMFGLRTDNVLEYFSQSPFYDRSSNNQVLKMQSQFNGSLSLPQDLSLALSTMRGVEFIIAMANPASALWLIRKQDRISSTETTPLATYFVINENIYMAPNVYSIVSSRMLATVCELRSALVLATDNLPNFAPTLGYTYAPGTLDEDEFQEKHQQERMMIRAMGCFMQLGSDLSFIDVPATTGVSPPGRQINKTAPQPQSDTSDLVTQVASKRKRRK
ncbi:MED6 mediator subfamily complex component-domain-containing protein [Lipomyces japonicus]|uniref:MED6 mediator subfamily complex component-domain-containing protein n=1 Tax=Lipomyces japonicus TaxID=56871 RepID=UPI0034CDF159